jgi:hypothetical protein
MSPLKEDRDISLSGAIYVGINMETLSHFKIALKNATPRFKKR